MLRTVGSLSSPGAAEQANQAGDLSSSVSGAAEEQLCRLVSFADAGGSHQGGYFDRLDTLRKLTLAPEGDASLRLMVPSRSLVIFDAASALLESSGFSLPLRAPLTQDQHTQLKNLITINAITRAKFSEVLTQSARLTPPLRPAGQRSLYSQASGANRSRASLGDNAMVALPEARGARPADNRVPRAPSTDRLRSASRSGRTTAQAASGDDHAIGSASAFATEEGPGRAHRGLNVGHGKEGVNPHDERRGPWVRFKGSDYFPQKKLSYVFLGAMGITGWWAGEVMKAATPKMQDPRQPKNLLVTQMLMPFVVFGVVMTAYLHMNKLKKKDDSDAAIRNQLNLLAGRQDRLVEDAVARGVGVDNV